MHVLNQEFAPNNKETVPPSNIRGQHAAAARTAARGQNDPSTTPAAAPRPSPSTGPRQAQIAAHASQHPTEPSCTCTYRCMAPASRQSSARIQGVGAGRSGRFAARTKGPPSRDRRPHSDSPFQTLLRGVRRKQTLQPPAFRTAWQEALVRRAFRPPSSNRSVRRVLSALVQMARS